MSPVAICNHSKQTNIFKETFSYATFKLADGLSFIHIGLNYGDEKNPLSGLSAFKRFQEGIKERCEQPPVATQVTEVGSYGFTFSAQAKLS